VTQAEMRNVGCRSAAWFTAGIPVFAEVNAGANLVLALAGAYLAERLAGDTGQRATTAVGQMLAAFAPRAMAWDMGSLLGDRAFALARAILASLELVADLPADTMPSMRPGTASLSPEVPVDAILRADETTLTAVVQEIEVASAYGQQPVRLEAGTEDALLAVTLERLRWYDLELGCRLLRAVAYLGGAAGMDQGLDFLVRQQRGDGAFGFVAIDLGPGVPPGDPRVQRDYHLPVTLMSLWTIAELTLDGFHLMGLLGSGRA